MSTYRVTFERRTPSQELSTFVVASTAREARRLAKLRMGKDYKVASVVDLATSAYSRLTEHREQMAREAFIEAEERREAKE